MKNKKLANKNIYKAQAEMCQCMANAKRLEILNILKDKVMPAAKIAAEMGISNANLSQHLTKMRESGILISRREGVSIFYSLSNPKIIQACRIMREILQEHLKKQGQLQKNLLKKIQL